MDGYADWAVEEGSVLDGGYVGSLGRGDPVYSWGVLALHHTGVIWQVLENVSGLVADNDMLSIATYDDQGWLSRYWRFIKRQYNGSPIRRAVIGTAYTSDFCLRIAAAWILKGERRVRRCMSRRHDLMDWLGGYAFEVAKPQARRAFFCRADLHENSS